jgi:hypothetical protein
MISNIKATLLKAMIIRGFSEEEIFDVISGTSEDNDNNLEDFLKDNNIMQIYNNKIGIRNISYPISVKFWSMLQDVAERYYCFKRN